MAVFHSYQLLRKHPWRKHQLVYGCLGLVFVFFSPLYAQEIMPSLQAYRTALATGDIGDWDDPATWQVWNGTTWEPATEPPSRNNDVFIEQYNEVRLRQPQEVGNLFLFADADAGKKLNLQVYDLNAYGALRCFTKTDDVYFLFNSTSLTEDWIYPESGNIVFKGGTRIVVDRSSWSGNNGQSRFGVIFNPDPGETLTVNAVFKASSFTIKSGTVYQTVNLNGAPATSSFSFNFQDKISTADYGDFIIEAGATLISEATSSFGELIFRTSNRPASNFHLKEGGSLILLGQEPIIEAVNIQLEGNVYYSGNAGTQQFIGGKMAGVSRPSRYNHLFLEGNAIKKPPDLIELTGNLAFLNGGELNTSDTAIHFTGEDDQKVTGIALDLKEAIIAKPAGVLSFERDLILQEYLRMESGQVDFEGNRLYLHGSYHYAAGGWDNLSQLIYGKLPTDLNASNSTFPFMDAFLGGMRSILLSGRITSANTSLQISYQQLPDVNWDPGFDDDGVPILYALNSYFHFDLGGQEQADLLEVWISTDNLIIVDEEHARLVGIDAAASGSHLSSQAGLAGRAISLADLHGEILTVGSSGLRSILPVTWLSLQAEASEHGNLVSWTTAKEDHDVIFVIFKSTDGMAFEEVGTVPGHGYSSQIQHYQFLDNSANLLGKIYYQVKSFDLGGNQADSPIFALTMSRGLIHIFPNPYEQGHYQLTISTTENIKNHPAQIRIKNVSGMLLLKQSGTSEAIAARIAEQIKGFPAGAYFIIVDINGQSQIIRWVKKQ